MVSSSLVIIMICLSLSLSLSLFSLSLSLSLSLSFSLSLSLSFSLSVCLSLSLSLRIRYYTTASLHCQKLQFQRLWRTNINWLLPKTLKSIQTVNATISKSTYHTHLLSRYHRHKSINL